MVAGAEVVRVVRTVVDWVSGCIEVLSSRRSTIDVLVLTTLAVLKTVLVDVTVLAGLRVVTVDVFGLRTEVHAFDMAVGLYAVSCLGVEVTIAAARL